MSNCMDLMKLCIEQSIHTMKYYLTMKKMLLKIRAWERVHYVLLGRKSRLQNL